VCVCVCLCGNKLWGPSPNTCHAPAPSVGLMREVAKEDDGEYREHSPVLRAIAVTRLMIAAQVRCSWTLAFQVLFHVPPAQDQELGSLYSLAETTLRSRNHCKIETASRGCSHAVIVRFVPGICGLDRIGRRPCHVVDCSTEASEKSSRGKGSHVCACSPWQRRQGAARATRTKGTKSHTPIQSTASTLFLHVESIALSSMSMCSGPITTMTMPQHWAAQGRRVRVVPPSLVRRW
jgi:hypothetical protein